MTYFMGEFSRKKNTLREKLIGTTNAGKAFRIGSAVSLAGLGAIGYNKRKALASLVKHPIDFYSTRVDGKDVTVMKKRSKVIKNPEYDAWQKLNKEQKSKIKMPNEYKEVPDIEYHDHRRIERNPRSFLGSGRSVNWGRVGKTVGIGTTTVLIPTSAAYLAANKKDKENINRRINNVYKVGRNTIGDARTWINTLHRVSR